MKTTQELFNEWKEVRTKSISYSRAGIDDNMNDNWYADGSRLYDRKKEIESELLAMGYEIIDGSNPYSFELKKI